MDYTRRHEREREWGGSISKWLLLPPLTLPLQKLSVGLQPTVRDRDDLQLYFFSGGRELLSDDVFRFAPIRTGAQ